jgi:nicotinate-nucleotide adenylyltransferase
MKIGIFGGTFDPPHLGHLILAAEAQAQLDLGRLLFVLTPNPPHKQSRVITPLEFREEMLLAAVEDNPAFELSRVEIDRPPPQYAVDTVRFLSKSFPEAELVYLMGGDSLQDLPTWNRPREFVQACHYLGVMRRPGDHIDLTDIESQIPGIGKKILFVDAPLLEISSSEIRQRVAHSRPYRYFLPQPVYNIIQKRNLYQN